MAEVVKEFDHWTANQKDGGYPWDKWLNGEIWRLTDDDLRKQDFVDLARYVHKVARKRGLDCKTKRWDWDSKTQTYGCLYVQAFPPKGKEGKGK